MPAKSRIFSELLAEEAENGSTLFPPRDSAPPAKRRKVGLNSRFDRMVESMNATYSSPKQSNNSRKRARSVGSSSVSSYGAPQTPLESYDGLQAGALGRDFAVIKMSNEEGDEDEDVALSNTKCRASLPTWLSETFSTLSKKHPLRLLLPRPLPQDASPGVQDALEHSSPQDNDANIFAFSPPHTSSPIPDNYSGHLESPINMNSNDVLQLNNDRNLQPASASWMPSNRSSSPVAVPFSTPGPASSISGPAPPKSHLTMLPTIYSSEDSPNASYFRAPSQVTHGISKLASPMKTSSVNHGWFSPTKTDYRNAFTDHELLPRYPDIAPALLNSLRPDCSFKPYSTVPDCQPFDTVRPEHDARDYVAAFSTPGPGYHTSHPFHGRSPEDESPESLGPTYGLDHTEIDFRWTPFDRKFPDSTAYTPSRALGTHANILDQDEIDALPPSSDEFSDQQKFHEPVYASSRSASSHGRLPIASSSDGVYDKFQQKPEPTSFEPEGPLSMQTTLHAPPAPQYPLASSPEPSSALRHSRLSTTSPFAYDVALSNSLAAGSVTAKQVSSSPQASPVAFAPASDIYISPLRDSEIPTRTPDFNELKLGLLDALERIAPELPRTKGGQADKEVDAIPDPSCSQDTIESWGGDDAPE